MLNWVINIYYLSHTQLEKQVHNDEEFARTLAMLDEAPQAKKVLNTTLHFTQTNNPLSDAQRIQMQSQAHPNVDFTD